jgi:hypothetical protein
LATEDADILDKGACEWESFAARQTSSGDPAVTGWATQVGCGVAYSSQFALAYNRANSAGTTAQGLTLLGKTGLIERTDDGLGLTLAWALGGAKESGSSFKHEVSLLNLVATKEIAPSLSAHANLGWLRRESTRTSSTTWNLAAELALGAGVDVMGEVYGDDRTKPWIGLGVRWRATEPFSLNGSYSVRTDTPRVKLWTLGFKLGF